MASKVAQTTNRPARHQGPHCISSFCVKSSRRQCNLFNERERKELFDQFWQMNWIQKQMYICQLIETTSTKERNADEKFSRRKYSMEYFLIRANGKRLQVCHKMFLNTFGLKEKMVRL